MVIALDSIEGILQTDTEALLAAMPTPRDPFREFKRAFSGIMLNPPTVWSMPRMTTIGEEGQFLEQVHLVTVKFGITGSDPDLITDAALDYMRAIDLALRNATVAELDPTILHLHPQQHDYGPLYADGKGFARFPELHVVVESVEAPF
jgi:hypothetical protein